MTGLTGSMSVILTMDCVFKYKNGVKMGMIYMIPFKTPKLPPPITLNTPALGNGLMLPIILTPIFKSLMAMTHIAKNPIRFAIDSVNPKYNNSDAGYSKYIFAMYKPIIAAPQLNTLWIIPDFAPTIPLYANMIIKRISMLFNP